MMIDKEPLVSIIVPVKNAVPYLHESLACIQNQTYSNIEVLCIDDNSTDESTSLLLEITKKDKRFKYFYSPGEGTGLARNVGLEKSKGEYLVFLDADDYFELDMIEKMLEGIQSSNADLLIASAYLSDRKTGRDIKVINSFTGSKTGLILREELGDEIFQISSPAPWNKMYRKSFVISHGFRYQNLQNYNDAFFSIVALACAERIFLLNTPFVHYRSTIGSITDKQRKYNTGCALDSAEAIHQYITHLPWCSGDMEKSAVKLCTNLGLIALSTSFLDKSQFQQNRKRFIKMIESFKSIGISRECLDIWTIVKIRMYQLINPSILRYMIAFYKRIAKM